MGDKYQAYCTMYKNTCYGYLSPWRCRTCPLERGIDLNAEDPEPTDIDNERTHSLDTSVALGGPEVEDFPEDPIYSNHDKLTDTHKGDKWLTSMSRGWKRTTSREFGTA